MRVIFDAQVHWQFLTAVYPLFKQALPRIERLGDKERSDLIVKNAITTIRHNILSIPLQLQQVQLNEELEGADFDKFIKALHLLLSVFERLVKEDVLKSAEDAAREWALHERSLQSQYPKLWILTSMLKNSTSDAPATDITINQNSNWDTTAEYPTEVLLTLARFIDFYNLNTALDYKYISKDIQGFHSVVQEVFKGSLGASDGDLGNAVLLREDEIKFIRRAHRLNTLSSSLFTLLKENTVCSKEHAARIYLSGFLDPEVTFDLLLSPCEKLTWSRAKCRWVLERPDEDNSASCSICFNGQHEKDTSKGRHIAFNNFGIWDDVAREPSVDPIEVPDTLPTLRDLVLPGTGTFSNSVSSTAEFEPEDQKIVELLLACSLFHLSASHWLRGGLDIDRILIVAAPWAQDFLHRWRPLITCSLGSSSGSDDDDDEVILAFGLLIMEMEAKKQAKPLDEDIDWVTGLPSRDSMLRRALADWKRRLEDGYLQIGKACLNFRELREKFYHPHLPGTTKRTAAIYRYILAPLYQLITQRYYNASLLFKGLPQTSKNQSVSHSSLQASRPSWSSQLTLFDDIVPDATWHNPTKISYASEFMHGIKPTIEMIRNLSDTSPPNSWETWRMRRIRIAIIDTGIDTDNDILMETSLEAGFIKECRGFVDAPEDYTDRHGHGTHVTRLIRELAPAAEIYVAKVSNERTIDAPGLSRIAEAIKWAYKEMEVDIISMSFGLDPDNRNVDIDKAIAAAIKANVTIFAAAANSGGNKPRAYPAKRNGVICIHASDGRGNDGEISPSPVARKANFSTLGISIESKWKGKKVFKTGTSFATPIAAALAADVLEFARCKCSLDEYEQECLHSFDGIKEILHLMAEERQGYDYIHPNHLWKSEETDIIRKITEIARS